MCVLLFFTKDIATDGKRLAQVEEPMQVADLAYGAGVVPVAALRLAPAFTYCPPSPASPTSEFPPAVLPESLSCVLAERQKERKKTDTPNEGWDEDRVPTCTSRILEERSGGQVGLSCS